MNVTLERQIEISITLFPTLWFLNPPLPPWFSPFFGLCLP
uniref:Uncharacterized protein n=1 Tax=Rhizophora mucronata TaxID=61149 RepID=A0A2P2MLT8_RHIMU